MSFGEFINEFYSALTKDLSFYQYMPLITLVTIIIVPVSVFFMSLLSMLLFNYEFNFFHLISFKKSNNSNNIEKQHQHELESIEQQKKDMLKLLSMVRTETQKLALNYDTMKSSIQTISSADSQQKTTTPAIQYNLTNISDQSSINENLEHEDLNKTVEKSIKHYFEKINSKEEELKAEMEALKNENKKLNEIISNSSSLSCKANLTSNNNLDDSSVSITTAKKELAMLNESGDFCPSNSLSSSMNSSINNCNSKKVIQINQIGLSKTLKANSPRVIKSSEIENFLNGIQSYNNNNNNINNQSLSKLRQQNKIREEERRNLANISNNFNRLMENNTNNSLTMTTNTDVEEDDDEEEDIYVILDEN
jgi:hypothetical protein